MIAELNANEKYSTYETIKHEEALRTYLFFESGFWEITFQTFLYLFVIRKVGQRKTLFSQRKI